MKSLRRILEAHLKAAKAYAELSYCRRLKVGAVLVSDGRIISIGYNGTATGSDNNCEYPDTDEGEYVLSDNSKLERVVTKPEVIHAETNVIAFAAKNGVSTNKTMMVITHSPCYECAKLIIQAGVVEVFYDEPYRDLSSIQFLRDNKVLVERIENVQTSQATS